MILRFASLAAAAALLSACAPQVPDSNPGGVGFSGYDQYASERARREAELAAMRPGPVPEGQAIASETMAALRVDRPVAGTAPVGAPSVPASGAPVAGTAPVAVAALPAEAVPGTDNPNISDEQDFSAVAGRESIASDADRLARNRSQYTVIQPGDLPQRSGASGPNIVAYALATNHPLGVQMFSRPSRPNLDRFNRACAQYLSNDRAQEAFLASGGPERDRRGLDPDGDGYACYWDPTPFRAARGG